jgi:glycine/D-amino acid oxidase-like deaminating enzyme
MSLTTKRDLRTGTPVWLEHKSAQLRTASLKNKTQIDVVVVGTGISGALVADALLQAGFSILVVDRRAPMSGSTPASTALLQSELDTPLTKLERKIGRENASRVWLRSAQSVQSLSDRVSDLQIECDFTPRSTLYLPGNVLGVSQLKKEAKARQKLGARSTFIDPKQLMKLSGIKRRGAIYTTGNAEANPVKLVSGLWHNFLNNGGRIVSDLEVTDVDQSRSYVRLDTKSGKIIFAKYAIFCTGYELMKFAQPKGYKIISTWALATKQQSAKIWPSKSLIWEASDPYLYLRSTSDGRIVVGGEDEAFSDEQRRDDLIDAKVKSIARKAKRLFPKADFDAQFAWCGSFGESPTGLPAIGPIKGMPRCYAVLGFGGNGITFSMLAAQLISRQIQGIPDPDAELFALNS